MTSNGIDRPDISLDTCNYAGDPERLTKIAVGIVDMVSSPGPEGLTATPEEVVQQTDASRCNSCPVVKLAGHCMLEQEVSDTMYVEGARRTLSMLAGPPWLGVYRLGKSGISPTQAVEMMQLDDSALSAAWEQYLKRQGRDVTPRDLLGGVYNTYAGNTNKRRLPERLANALTIPDSAFARTDSVRVSGKPFKVTDFSRDNEIHNGVRPLSGKAAVSLISEFVRLTGQVDDKKRPALVSPQTLSANRHVKVIARFDVGTGSARGTIIKIEKDVNGKPHGLYVGHLPAESGEPDHFLIFGGCDDGGEEDLLRDTGLSNLITPTRR